jgi:hypothetical protein
MSGQRALVGVLLAAVAVVGLALGSGPLRAADTGEYRFEGKAARVSVKGPVGPEMFIEQPRVRMLGDRPFVVGKPVGGRGLVWLPLADVILIEEFADVKEMGKVYRLPGAGKD